MLHIQDCTHIELHNQRVRQENPVRMLLVVTIIEVDTLDYGLDLLVIHDNVKRMMTRRVQ